MIKYKNISLADQVFETIELNILTETYKRGEVISESRLTEELGVSRTPIREALSRLTEEGLIEDTPSGTVVVGVSYEDLDDYYEVRKQLEGLVCGRAVGHIDEETMTHLQDIVDQQDFYLTKNDTEKLRNLDSEFHETIYRNCGSRVLGRLLSGLHHRSLRYRRTSLQYIPERAAESIREHRDILEALKANDSQKSKELMDYHVMNSHQSMVQMREEGKK